MTKPEMLRSIASKTKFRQTDIAAVIDALRETIIEALNNDEEIRPFEGLVFTPFVMEAREVKSVRDGEIIHVPAKKTAKAHVTRRFRDLIK